MSSPSDGATLASTDGSESTISLGASSTFADRVAEVGRQLRLERTEVDSVRVLEQYLQADSRRNRAELAPHGPVRT